MGAQKNGLIENPQHVFWMRNKKIIILLRILISSPLPFSMILTWFSTTHQTLMELLLGDSDYKTHGSHATGTGSIEKGVVTENDQGLHRLLRKNNLKRQKYNIN